MFHETKYPVVIQRWVLDEVAVLFLLFPFLCIISYWDIVSMCLGCNFWVRQHYKVNIIPSATSRHCPDMTLNYLKCSEMHWKWHIHLIIMTDDVIITPLQLNWNLCVNVSVCPCVCPSPHHFYMSTIQLLLLLGCCIPVNILKELGGRSHSFQLKKEGDLSRNVFAAIFLLLWR